MPDEAAFSEVQLSGGWAACWSLSSLHARCAAWDRSKQAQPATYRGWLAVQINLHHPDLPLPGLRLAHRLHLASAQHSHKLQSVHTSTYPACCKARSQGCSQAIARTSMPLELLACCSLMILRHLHIPPSQPNPKIQASRPKMKIYLDDLLHYIAILVAHIAGVHLHMVVAGHRGQLDLDIPGRQLHPKHTVKAHMASWWARLDTVAGTLRWKMCGADITEDMKAEGKRPCMELHAGKRCQGQ